MKLYILYDPNGFYLSENYFEIQPENSTEVPRTENFVKYKFDIKNNVWIEGCDQEELAEINQEFIAEMRIKYDELIDELVRVPIQKKLLRNIEIPQAIKDEAERLRVEFYQVTNQTPPKETTPLVNVSAKIK